MDQNRLLNKLQHYQKELKGKEKELEDLDSKMEGKTNQLSASRIETECLENRLRKAKDDLEESKSKELKEINKDSLNLEKFSKLK